MSVSEQGTTDVDDGRYPQENWTGGKLRITELDKDRPMFQFEKKKWEDEMRKLRERMRKK